MKCPNCNLINPDSAIRCDCGYDFVQLKITDSFYYNEDDRNYSCGISNSIGNIFGGLLPILGLFLIIPYLSGTISLSELISEYVVSIIIGIIIYLITPKTIITNKNGFTTEHMYNLKLKYHWAEIKYKFELNVIITKKLFIITKYMIITVDSYGMIQYNDLIREINYWNQKRN